jgi:pimeloyl-ACP methyl ester carboxylesterase
MRMLEPDLPLILLPGLNGDPRVFARQLDAFPHATIVSWPQPVLHETLCDYARRLAESIHPDRPCVIGGVSFGGIVAIEVARHLPAKACIVMASARDARGLPAHLRVLRPLALAIPAMILDSAIGAGWTSAAMASPRVGRQIKRMSADEAAFRRWALRAMMTWKPIKPTACPIFQIHGTHDSSFPRGSHFADAVVANAGHMLTLTHAEAVNALVDKVLRKCQPK